MLISEDLLGIKSKRIIPLTICYAISVQGMRPDLVRESQSSYFTFFIVPYLTYTPSINPPREFTEDTRTAYFTAQLLLTGSCQLHNEERIYDEGCMDSNTRAEAPPPPLQTPATPNFACFCLRIPSNVTIIRAPLQPIG